jgi:acylphosphatase
LRSSIVEDRAGRGQKHLLARIVAVTVRRRAIVQGRVQGVWFRDSTRERAIAHGVCGWVRNRPDGAVEAVLEGSPEAVEHVVRFLRTGPPHAHVERIELVGEQPEGLSGFEIR